MTIRSNRPPVGAPPGLTIQADAGGPFAQILTPKALDFVRRLAEQFDRSRQELLDARRVRQARLDAGELPDFLPETRGLRASPWTVAPIPHDLRRRHVEITGPVDRKMIINALNCGADCFMADFEDANSPTWSNLIEGQINLRDAIRRTIEFTSPEGKTYRLNEKTATLLVRPRGWHLDEKHVTLDGRAISASLFDFGLYFFHNARELLARGSGPYFYLPKLEGHLEARLWNDVFVWSQNELGIPNGTVRATVLIETILAAFETDEILYELRDHSAGLNCGRWDYIFSLIKKLGKHRRFLLSDRGLVTMTTPFMRAYSLLTIKTCHRRGIHAMGGMAAQIPIRNDPAANEAALAAVRADKKRESEDGHDGTWVAHPGLVPIAREEFARIGDDNQIRRQRDDVNVLPAYLLAVPDEPQISEAGIRRNISVGIQYVESWLRGQGCVPISNLMEDAATAEISRAQLWQWVRHQARMIDRRTVSIELIDSLMRDELDGIRASVGDERFTAGRFNDARELFTSLTRARECPEFLTSLAYERL